MTTTSDWIALTKAEIVGLPGGRVRGVQLLFEVELSETVRAWVFGQLGNQFQSQRQSLSHPEGWEPIIKNGIDKVLPYDIQTATLEMPVPDVSYGGLIRRFSRRCPATVFRYDGRRVKAVLSRRQAGAWTARFDLLRAIEKAWADANIIGAIISEHLGIRWRDNTSEAIATRLIAYVYELDERTCRALTALVSTSISSQALALVA